MKIDLKVLSDNKAQSTTGSVGEFRLSDDAKGIVFQMLTDGIYSNPIGSIVREIASNCFDSHAEAGVNTPVIVKRSYDETSDTHYISFIDYGVGMSPDRIENVYGVYLESTKRETNDQIGGFGIGGKTPLAYKRTTFNEKGEKMVDTSFFVITNYDVLEVIQLANDFDLKLIPILTENRYTDFSTSTFIGRFAVQ
jgi:hypothetical protein